MEGRPLVVVDEIAVVIVIVIASADVVIEVVARLVIFHFLELVRPDAHYKCVWPSHPIRDRPFFVAAVMLVVVHPRQLPATVVPYVFPGHRGRMDFVLGQVG